MGLTLPCPGEGLQAVPGAAGPLREFRERLHECLTARGDTLFELADAVLCSDRPVRSLVQLSLEPEFRRGHGALYDALAAGQADDERLFSLLTTVLPPLVDGPEARAWITEHDVIGRRMLDRALSGVPAADAARVRDACARWSRPRIAVDATSYPRPDAWCSPGREHVHHGACHCKGPGRTTPGWEYQLAAVTGHLRTAWAAVVDVQRTTPATRTAQTVAQVKSVLRRLPASGAVPLFVFDAGYSAAALTDGLAGLPRARPGPPPGRQRLLPGRARLARQERPSRAPGAGGPLPGARRPRGGSRGAGQPGPEEASAAGPEPDEELALLNTPLYGTVRAEAWHDVHPQVHGDRGWFAGREKLPVLRGTLFHVTAERLPDGRDPHRQLWLWHAGPGPLSLDELWRAYLARFDIEHAIRVLKGTLGLTAAKVRAPEQADRWVRVVIAAHAQLLLARPLASDLRRPWEKHPDPTRPLTPGRVRRGFRNIHHDLGTPARVPKPTQPGPGRPKGSSKGPAPRHLLPGEAGMPRTAKQPP